MQTFGMTCSKCMDFLIARNCPSVSTVGRVCVRKIDGKIVIWIDNSFYLLGDIWAFIEQYQKNVCSKLAGRKRPSKTLFDYIYNVYGDFDNDTDEEGPSYSVDSEQSKEMGALAGWQSNPSPDYAAETPWVNCYEDADR